MHENLKISKHLSLTRIFWLILWLFVLTVKGQFNITKVNSGVYIEDLGEVLITSGSFRIQVIFEKSRIQQDIKQAEEIDENFEIICNKTTIPLIKTECASLQHHLQIQTKKLQWIKHDLAKIQQKRKNRVKRGMFGKLLTAIFGVNDDVYRDIDKLDKNQQELIKASKNQTHVMMSTVVNLNNIQENIDRQLKGFQEQLNMKQQFMTDTKIYIQMTSAYQLGLGYINEVCDHYKKLTRIGLSKSDFLEIISPEDVSEAVEISKTILPNDKSVLGSYLLKTSIKQNDTHIIIAGYFPIIDNTEYNLLKLTATPLKISNDTYTTLEMPNNFIGVNYNKQYLFEMGKEEYTECIFIENNKYVCASVVVKKLGVSDNCVIEAIFKNDEPCAYKILKHDLSHIVWKQLLLSNTWLFITNKIVSIGVECSGRRTNAVLQGSGILKVDTGCSVDSKQHVLLSSHLETYNVVGSYIQSVNISWSEMEVMKPRLKESVYKHLDTFDVIIDKERKISEELNDTSWKSFELHQSHAWFLIFGVVLSSVVTYFVIMKYQNMSCLNKKKKKKKRNDEEVNPELRGLSENKDPSQEV